MKRASKEQNCPQEYAACLQRLAQTGWISEGYVQIAGQALAALLPVVTQSQSQDRSLALSKEQYLWLKERLRTGVRSKLSSKKCSD